MKSIIGLVVFCSAVALAQSPEDLTEEQRREYQRRKLTIQVRNIVLGDISSRAKGATLRAGTMKQWRAHEGIGHIISEEEFFSIAGYENEAEKAAARKKRIVSVFVAGAALSVGGLILGSIKETEVERSGYGEYQYTYEVTTYPYEGPAIVITSLGLGLMSGVTIAAAQNNAPASVAEEIAQDYNRRLVLEILKE